MEDDKSVVQELREVAFSLLRTLINYAGPNGTFRGMFTVVIGGEEKPVLVLGNAHGRPHEDGHAIAVLNPDRELQDILHAGTAYSGGLLKETVAGKCDAMVELWLDAYKTKKDGENTLEKYVSRSPAETKFRIR